MSKYKIGETVVVVTTSHPSMYGTRFVVAKINESYFTRGFLVFDSKTKAFGWHEDSVVSEEVFNSPLYQAMKEE